MTPTVTKPSRRISECLCNSVRVFLPRELLKSLQLISVISSVKRALVGNYTYFFMTCCIKLSSEWVYFLFPNGLSFPHEVDSAGKDKQVHCSGLATSLCILGSLGWFLFCFVT